ncbi:MAG: hypothetical protein GWO20_19425 [Candidatus Korarchaeota archaeon]|nr:hypothetical protein [Candidatus Korarchaeota archaeon]NIU83649.1 hypothetical protein [Candidatus Thorarchaeota archaeon]NIW15525.1 hypothetical protein [Candidatus Thorarchaeota archaeon]NIW53470.1 hypothetical protein [Candidatus Korarchaeota archaeon]
MDDKNPTETLVDKYMERVKKNLPGWLKTKEEKRAEILAEVEQQIWETAEELSETRKVTEDSVRRALVQLGSPKNILKEYQQRGTPKVYISEEWWPYYKSWMIGAFIVVTLLHVAAFLYNVFMVSVEGALASLNLYVSLFWMFTVITVIFVVLSTEGFLPKDLNLHPKKPWKKEKVEGLPISPEIGRPLKPILKPTEVIVGGIFSCIFGGLFFLLPHLTIGVLIHPDFYLILRLGGVIIIAEGINDIGRGILGNEAITGQQMTLIVSAILKIAAIPVLFLILRRPEIFPIIYYSGDAGKWSNMQIPNEYYKAFQNIFGLIIIIQIVLAIYSIYKAGTLEKYKLWQEVGRIQVK